jgi:hypothetical protein
MKKTIAILVLAVAGIASANAGIHFGFNFGIPLPAPVVVAPAPVFVAPAPVVAAPVVVEPPMPAPIVETVPVCPTPGYVWVGGNWGWCDNHWVWTRGHWGAPVHFEHARFVNHGYRVEHHDGFRAYRR